MKFIRESRKDLELYFNGCFWVIADSYKDILLGKFNIDGTRYLVDIDGNEIEKTSKSSKVHENVWKDFQTKYPGKGCYYYPRGRVNIYNGEAYININSKINLPQVIDSIIDYYELHKFNNDEIHIFDIDNIQKTSHYDFELR